MIVISSRTIGGALRPVEQLQAIFGYRHADLFPERVFLPGTNRLLHDDGYLTNPDLEKRLGKQAEGVANFVASLRGKRLRS